VSEPTLAGLRVAVDGRYARRPGMGIHVYLRQVIRLLHEAGAEVTLLVNFPVAEAATDGFEGVRWESFGSPVNILWEQRDVSRHLRRGRYDLYWALGNSGIPFLPVGRTRRVFTLHDLIPLLLPRMHLWGRPLYAGPYLIWTLAGVLRSDVILTISAASAKDLKKLFRRSSVIAPSVFYEDLLPTAEGAADGPPPSAEGFEGLRFVLYNGGLDPRKNVDNLLAGFAHAAARDPDLQLVLMGRGYDRLLPRIAELGIADRTILTGFVSDERKLEIMRAATALVYPSLYEGFGLPLLEAFSQRVPVVTSPNSSLVEVAGDAAIFVDPHDPAAIGEGILAVQDPAVADRLRALGTRRWEAYDPAAIRATVVATLAELAATGKRR
jgi:glycosyltransferase involved in cell wall biosynthesis